MWNFAGRHWFGERSFPRCAPTVGTSGLSLLLLSACSDAQHEPVDMVVTNGYVYTVDMARSVAEAVAISDGKIVYVGSDRDARQYVGDSTEIVDLEGRMVMPGIHDGHMHPLSLGGALEVCSLNYEPLTLKEVRERVMGCLRQPGDASPDRLLQVSHWAWGKIQPPRTKFSKADLDEIPTERPIRITATSSHISLVNSRALELAGIAADTPDPHGGEIKRDADGEPTGVLVDAAQGLGGLARSADAPEDSLRKARIATQAMSAQGATSFLDAGANEASLQAMKALADGGDLPIRANFAIRVSGTAAEDAPAVLEHVERLKRAYSQPLTATAGLNVRTVKLVVDGDFMSPSLAGAFLEPYLHNVGTPESPEWVPSDNDGELYVPPPVLNPLVELLDQQGWQVHVHSNGDRGTRTMLDAVERAQAANKTGNPTDNRRHTITHLLLIDQADIPRFSELDVIASMSLQWPKRDEYHVDLVAPFIGPERFSRIYASGPLLDSGATVAYGSDAPVDPLNYWYAMEVAVTRDSEMEGKYAGPLNADYALTLEQAVEAFTIGSAYQLKQENVTGTLEPGKFADLIVLDRNIFDIPIREVSDTKVLMTIVGGKIVHQTGR